MSVFAPVSEKKAIKHPHFPDNFLAVIWRFWGKAEPSRLADVLDATQEQLRDCAALMGLNPDEEYNPVWRTRGYITLIRNSWHLLEYDQICTLLGFSVEELATILKEDDFLFHKLGHFKPAVERPRYHPLTEKEWEDAAKIASVLSAYGVIDTPDKAFRFLDDFYKAPKGNITVLPDKHGDLKMIYSYFALYGDPLLNPEADPFPDALLEKYAGYGINGVWLQGVLYQLVPYPFDPSLSEGWERRIESLNALVKRAARYGIGVYLYLNEPRNMPLSFFDKFPHLKGHTCYPGFAALCTSAREVRDYLSEASYQLFHSVPGLGGFFTISRSENQTNCYSHSDASSCNCPRCSTRPLEDVLAEANNLLARGAHRASPKARAIAWNWGWDYSGRMHQIIEKLDADIIVQATSERGMKYQIGGIKGEVEDYTMSLPGPGELAKSTWNTAIRTGHEACAKVQFNNTWEVSGVPYIPVFDLLAEYVCNLKNAGVRHIMLSWTLGGSPSPNLGLVNYLLQKDDAAVPDVYEYIKATYGVGEAQAVYTAQKSFCEAFRCFPFHIGVLYNAPQTSGPKSPFFVEPSGYNATMVCYPYDAVRDWASIYPADVFEEQFRMLCEKWSKGLDILRAKQSDRSALYEELINVAQGALVHFRTVLNLTCFTRARDKHIASPDKAAVQRMLKVLDDEERNVLDTISLISRDSRIGFEASNHYSFTKSDLLEKLLNINYSKEYINSLRIPQ
ncbi:MAG: hypothetical protein AB9835_05235 [Eubacteriales bacterium]